MHRSERADRATRRVHGGIRLDAHPRERGAAHDAALPVDHRPRPADERDAEGGDTADQDRPARAKRRAHPPDERRADRGCSEEHEGVQGHDAPALIRIGARLDQRTGARVHRQHAETRGDRQEGKPPVGG